MRDHGPQVTDRHCCPMLLQGALYGPLDSLPLLFLLLVLQNFSHLLAQPLADFRPILTGSAAESNATNAVVAARVLDEGSCPSGGSAQESEARPLLTTGPCDLGLLGAYS